MRTQVTIILLILNGLFYSGFAQLSNLDRNNPTSPKSANLIDEVKVPVNFYRGLPEIEVPLHTISEEFELDLTLKYDPSGLHLAELSGWVGLNWKLDAGGIITRIKRGRTIDEHYNGYINSGGRLNDAVWTSVTENPNTSADVNQYFERANSYYDAEPDFFYFTFGKYHGQFRFQHNGSIMSDNPAIKIQPQFKYYPEFNNTADIIAWIITAEDGTIFEFMKYEYFDGSMSSTGSQCAKGNGSSFPRYNSSWYLTKIIASNKRIIDYFYNPTRFEQLQESCDDYLVIDPSIIDNDHIKNYSQNKFKQYYLDSIKTDIETVVFECDEAIERVTRKLSRVKIYNNTNHSLFQTITFGYEDLACTDCWEGNNRFLLKTINKITPEGVTQLVRSFTYDTTPIAYFNVFDYGFVSTAGRDHWGFYNGPQTSNYNSLIPAGSSYDNYFNGLSFYVGIPSRTPDLTFTKAGTLTEMKYPTGGTVVFNYELNDYSYVNNSLIKPSKITGGGLRIQSVTFKYGNGNPDVVKTYSYISKENSALSSGVIDNEPNYEFSFNINNYYPNTPTYSSKSSQTLNPISIGYSRVIEQISGAGKTVYEYTTARNYPYQPSQNQFCYYSLNNTYGTSGYIKTTHPFKSEYDNDGFKRGLLINKSQYDNTGLVVERDSTNYIFKTYTGDNEFSLRWIEFCSPTKIYNICFLNLYPSSIGVALTNEVINFKYGNSQAFNKIQYIYNDVNIISQVKSYQSDGSTFTTKYKYPSDYYWGSTPTYNGESYNFKLMVDRNIINIPIEKTTLKNNQVTGSALTLFYLKNDIIVPKEFYTLEFTTPFAYPTSGLSYTTLASNQVSFSKSSYYKLFEQYQEYNTKGNPLQITGSDGITTSYLWDATGNYQMAQVKGATYSQISTQEGKTSTYFSKTLWNSLNSLVPNAMSTTYSYKPLVGMAEQTDPTNVTTYCLYDSFGRLELGKDDDQKLLKKYGYHFFNQ